MSANNRTLRGNTKQIKGTVAGSVTIEPGDLVGANWIDGTYGVGGPTLLNEANGYIYPLSWCRPATAEQALGHAIGQTFAGVAMTGSANGVTNEITVGIDGIARYPVIPHGGDVTQGARVSAVSGTEATGSKNQTVAVDNLNTAANTTGTTAYLGIVSKTESGASFVDFKLWSSFMKGQMVTVP